MFEKWRIKEHMEVTDSTGQHIGTVDEVEDNRIKLTRSDASDAMHHYVDIDMVDRIDDNRVYLKPGTPQPFMSGSDDRAELQGANAGGSAASSDLPGYENKLFGTSGTGTGMGGSGEGEH